MQSTWMLADIGNKKYAINTDYVNSISNLKSDDFLSESTKPFVRGIYKMLNSEIPCINGRKLACEPTLAEENTIYSKRWTGVKLEIMKWLDAIDTEIFMGEKSSEMGVLELGDDILDHIDKIKGSNSTFITRQEEKLKKLIKQNITRLNKALDNKNIKNENKGSESYVKAGESYEIAGLIRRDIERYAYDTIESIIEAFCSDKNEVCIMIKLNETIFGIVVDQVSYINEPNISISKHEKTFLSAGTLLVNGKEFNIINLSKLIRLI